MDFNGVSVKIMYLYLRLHQRMPAQNSNNTCIAWKKKLSVDQRSFVINKKSRFSLHHVVVLSDSICDLTLNQAEYVPFCASAEYKTVLHALQRPKHLIWQAFSRQQSIFPMRGFVL